MATPQSQQWYKGCRIALLVSGGIIAVPAVAQERTPDSVVAPAAVSMLPAEGSRVYTPQDFARFAPRNALEMIRQVPGFVIREAVEERGLGQATGNVLVDGQRISGKSNDILAELGRIPAQNVARIEILDGAALNIPGLSGQVANVITSGSEGISGQFAWYPDVRAHFTDPNLLRFEASISGTIGPVEYTLGLENQANHSGAGGETLIFDPTGDLLETRHDIWTGELQQPRMSGRFVIDGPGTSVGNLNFSLRQFWYDYVEEGFRTGLSRVDRTRTVRTQEDGHEYELGGDYTFALGSGRLKFIGLSRWEHARPDTVVMTIYADRRPDAGERFTRREEQAERIARAEYSWTTSGSDWQISAESAFNSLDNISRLFALSPSGDFEEEELPGATARVEEDRYELMLTYGRPLSQRFSFQLSLGGEYSRLTQTGSGDPVERTFWRPKGQLTAAWNLRSRTQLNFALRRRVGQLNFLDFLASVNLNDDRENAGNPDLVPPQSWEAEVEAVHNLGSLGRTSVRLFGHLIEDIVDIVPIGATGESIGNLDQAVVYGAEWKSTLLFDPLGWRGAKVDARFLVQGSSVDDPLTGENRPISNSTTHVAEATFRWDVPEGEWAFGGGVSYSRAALDYRLTELGRLWEGPVWAHLYVEHKDVLGLTVRATINNIIGAESMWDRTVYVGRRTGPIDFIEQRDRTIGPMFTFQLRGRF